MKINYATDNAAFNDAEYEHTEILSKIMNKISEGFTEGVIHDSNGNKIGAWKL